MGSEAMSQGTLFRVMTLATATGPLLPKAVESTGEVYTANKRDEMFRVAEKAYPK